jgi:hypothetical protein
MHRKKIMLLAICTVAVIAVSLFITISLFTRNLPSSVIRNFDTSDEKRALTAAETVDYASIAAPIWALKRFEGSSDPKAYIHSGGYSYAWANFIDSKVIDYYQNRYDYQQKQLDQEAVTFTYNANVTYLEQLHIFDTTRLEQATVVIRPDTNQKENITWYTTDIIFQGSDKSTPLATVNPFKHMLCRNQSEYYALTTEFDLTFSNCYFIEMTLQYSEVHGPLAAFMSDVHQIVVLDQNLVPIWIGITTFQGIS